MTLPRHKTKTVCTTGPASVFRLVMIGMIHAGMDGARLDFSRADFGGHKK